MWPGGGKRQRDDPTVAGRGGGTPSTETVGVSGVFGVSSAAGRLVVSWGERAAPWIIRVASLGVLLVAWEIYGRQQETTLFFAPLTEVVSALWDLVQTSEFWTSYRETLIPFVYGWTLAMVIGVPLGLLIGRFTTLDRVSAPYLAFLNALPISTLVPVIVVGFGIGMDARTTVVFLFAIVEVVINTAAGARYVDPNLIEMARSFGASELQILRRIILPGSMPGMMAGVRIGTGRAVVGMIVVEILLVSVGVGRLIDRYRSRFRGPELFAVVLSLAIFGIVLLALVRQLEARLLRWRHEQGVEV